MLVLSYDNECGTFAGLVPTNFVGILYEILEFCLAVVSCYFARPVTQEVLTVLKGYTCSGTFKGRLTGNGLYRIIRKLGKQVGTEVRCNGIRHAAITQCCKAAAAANPDISDVLAFSRHASLATLQIYVDKERNLQGKLRTLVAVGAEQ